MTLVELMVSSTVLIVLMGMVFIAITMVEGLSNSVSSQYQEFQQALPAMAPFHGLLAAQVEPAPMSGGIPTPAFAAIGNFSMIFYSNIGTAYNNTVACPSGCPNGGTTAGPAMIKALELDGTGALVTAKTACNAAHPCSFQLRMYLPLIGLQSPGVSSCPDVGTGPTCQYGTNYRLLANVQSVVNDPSSIDATTGLQVDPSVPISPIFRYALRDPGGTYPNIIAPINTYTPQLIALTPAEIETQTINGPQTLSYPMGGQLLTACTAPNPSYQTAAAACPADAVQSVNIDLQVGKPGTGINGTQENSLVVYRYAQSPGSSTAPYQYSSAVG